MKGWRKIPAAAEYYGVSVRTMRTLIKDYGFPASRLPTGTQLVDLERGNEWLRSFDIQQSDQSVVDEILGGLGK